MRPSSLRTASSFLRTACSRVSTARLIARTPGTTRKVEKSNQRLRKTQRLQTRRLRRPTKAAKLRQVEAPAAGTQKKAARQEDIRQPADWAPPAKVEQNRRRCCRQTSPTIFRCSTRAQCFNF